MPVSCNLLTCNFYSCCHVPSHTGPVCLLGCLQEWSWEYVHRWALSPQRPRPRHRIRMRCASCPMHMLWISLIDAYMNPACSSSTGIFTHSMMRSSAPVCPMSSTPASEQARFISTRASCSSGSVRVRRGRLPCSRPLPRRFDSL